MTAVLDAPWIESDDMAGLTEPKPESTRTTLFDLISALQDTTGPDDDATVVAAVADLLQTGRIRFLNGAMESN
jgi:hypothetical protein